MLFWVTGVGLLLRAATPEEQKVERVLAAMVDFETKFRACTNLADTGYAAAEFARVIERELPKQTADKLLWGMGDYYYKNGGLWGYQRFSKGVSAPVVGIMQAYFPTERIGLLIQANEIERSGKAGDANWAAKAASWPTAMRGVTGKPTEGDWIDLRSVRNRALFEGNYGAVLDLAYVSSQGANVPKDGGLFDFWCHVAYRVNPTLHNQVQKETPGTIACYRVMAGAGSCIVMTTLADELNKTNTTSVLVPEARQWYEKAAALGHKGSARVLERSKTVIAAAKPSEPVVQTMNVATSGANVAASTSLPSQPGAGKAESTPQSRARIATVLEQFGRNFNAATNYHGAAIVTGEMLRELKPLAGPKIFDAMLNGAFQFFIAEGGLGVTCQFILSAPPELKEPLVQALKTEKSAAVRKALPIIAAGRFDDPAVVQAEVEWKPKERSKVTPPTAETFVTSIARERFATGDAGGAIDLLYCSVYGLSTPLDGSLAKLWARVVEHLVPEVMSAKTNEERLELMTKSGSAARLSEEARKLLETATDDNARKSAIAQLARARKGGDLRAEKALKDFERKLTVERNARGEGIEEKAEEIAKAVREGRFADVLKSGRPSAAAYNRNMRMILADAYELKVEQVDKLLTAKIRELAAEIDAILKARKLVFFGQEVFDATDPSKADELMQRVIAQASPPYREQLAIAREEMMKENPPGPTMDEAIQAAQQSEALRFLRVAERGNWRSARKGKTLDYVTAGKGFDAIFDLSSTRITRASLKPLPIVNGGQVESGCSFVFTARGSESYQLTSPMVLSYDHSTRSLELSGERLLHPGIRGKFGKMEKQPEMDGRLSFRITLKNDGTIFFFTALHAEKSGKYVSLFERIKDFTGTWPSQDFVFVPEK